MKRPISCVFAVISAASLVLLPAPRQASDGTGGYPRQLEKYDFVVRGRMSRERGLRPQQVAAMDSNGEILVACRESLTPGQLEASGIVFLRSQLELLVDWGLLTYDGRENTYKTTIHVYGIPESTALRELVRAAVERTHTAVGGGLALLKGHLEAIGREKSLFAVLYGYVLHSYSMGQFGQELYQKPQLSAKNPYWNGFSWAVYPIRKFPAGVTALPVEETTYFFVSAGNAPRPSFQDRLAFANSCSRDGRLTDPALLSTYSSYDVVNDKGELTVPVFSGDWAETLKNMARTVYAETKALAGSAEMKEILGMDTQAQREMFLHYEIRYAFLDLLLENAFMTAPVDLEEGDKSGAADAGNLIFLIRDRQGGVVPQAFRGSGPDQSIRMTALRMPSL